MRVPKRKAPPYTYKLIREIDQRISGTPGGKQLVEDLRRNMELVQNVERRRQRMTMESVMGRPKMKEKDLIISSFGKHPFELKRPSQDAAKYQMEKRAMESVAKFDDDPEASAPPTQTTPASPLNESQDQPPTDPAYRKWMP
jgi:hypothetical protein